MQEVLVRISHTPRSQATEAAYATKTTGIWPSSLLWNRLGQGERGKSFREEAENNKCCGLRADLSLTIAGTVGLEATQQSCGYAFFKFPKIWKKVC
jgi:hypothetical protein